MTNTPTYDQLSALCAQLAAALNAWMVFSNADDPAYKARWEVRGRVDTIAALTAYATMSPDPQWQRVPEGHVCIRKDLIDAFPELNMGNYSDDDVKALNDWGIEVALYDPFQHARGEG